MATFGCTPRPTGASISTLTPGLPVGLTLVLEGAPSVLGASPEDSGDESPSAAPGAATKTTRVPRATSLPSARALPRMVFSLERAACVTALFAARSHLDTTGGVAADLDV